jgi:hypothetical protein
VTADVPLCAAARAVRTARGPDRVYRGGVRRLLVIAVLLGTAALAASCGDDAPTTADPGASTAEGPTTTASTPAGPGAVADAFRAFARGGPPPPMAGRVDIYLGNAFTGFVTKRTARDPAAWRTCTEIGTYAGRDCPFSALQVVRTHATVAGPLPRGRCLARFGPVPPDLAERESVALVPSTASDCPDDFAVRLFTDEAGRLVAVDLLLGRR